MPNDSHAIEDSREFSQLESAEAYGLYFNLLSAAGQRLLTTYASAESRDSYEAKMMQSFLAKFLFTIHTLRIKFAHHPAHNREMWIDLSESGFPNHAEIAKLETDMLTRESQLQDISNASLLKVRLLDHMFAKHEVPKDMLWQLAERTYLEMLDPNALFLAFTPGELVRQMDTKTSRAYIYPWGCYDFETNRPYLHVMAFEQDKDQVPLETDATALRQFLKIVRAEGSRVPDLAILAMEIDDALEAIHPKILKRICIGPLYSPLLLNGTTEEEEARACSLLKRYGKRIDDFMLFYMTEVVFSQRQTVSRGFLSSKAKVREIFHIPDTDEEAFRRRASVVHQDVMMPHVVLQHLGPDDRRVLKLDGVKIVTYDEKGDVHGA